MTPLMRDSEKKILFGPSLKKYLINFYESPIIGYGLQVNPHIIIALNREKELLGKKCIFCYSSS